MLNSTEKMVDVGGFPIPEDQAEQFCEMEGVIGYFADGDEVHVSLDPFEVPAMRVAHERGKLLEYILAANGIPVEYYEQHLRRV